jgi:hypothetical protein
MNAHLSTVFINAFSFSCHFLSSNHKSSKEAQKKGAVLSWVTGDLWIESSFFILKTQKK